MSRPRSEEPFSAAVREVRRGENEIRVCRLGEDMYVVPYLVILPG